MQSLDPQSDCVMERLRNVKTYINSSVAVFFFNYQEKILIVKFDMVCGYC